MAFPKKLLNDNEDIVLDLRPHWMYFLEPIYGIGVLLLVTIFIAWVSSSFNTTFLWYALGIAFVAWLAWTGWRLVNWNSINFVVTTDRVIYRSGVLSKSGIQIPLERINNVNFHQRLWERMFGAGDLLIESAGTSGQSRFSDVNHPDHIQNVIYKAMETNENKGWQQVAHAASQVADAATPAAPVAGVSLAQELATLEGLRDRGTITPEEFERQKQRLLGSLPPPASPPPPPPAP
jgi:uncharacterized membrane protein YdbT with pleckstrin-like domain